jgi:hypothetical protein
MGWKGYASRREHLFGGVIDTILGSVAVPVLLCRVVGTVDPGRVVIHVGGRPTSTNDLAVEVGVRIAGHAQIPLLAIGPTDGAPGFDLAQRYRRTEVIADARDPTSALAALAQEGDLVLVATPPGGSGLASTPEEVARGLPHHTVVVCADRSFPLAVRQRTRRTPTPVPTTRELR